MAENHIPSTHYQAHQRLARRKSRQLLFAFGLCLLLCVATYGGVAYWLFSHTAVRIIPYFLATHFTNGHAIASTYLPIAIAAAVAFAALLVILWGYYGERKRLLNAFAEQHATEMGGVELPLKNMTLRQQQYRNIVEEMAIAAGQTVPQIFILPKDASINAFVTAGFADTVAICVSQGALDYLNREELQALIAHEFGHIKNQDVQTNINLVAILHSFYMLRSHPWERQHIHNTPDMEYVTADKLKDIDITPEGKQQILLAEMRRQRIAAEQQHQQHETNDGLNGNIIALAYSLFSLVVTAIMILFGKLIQATFSRQREWLADAYAVEYTRNKAALVSVLQKAIALQQMKVDTPPMSATHTHFLFINYQNKWLSTHPPLAKRLARYGRAMLQDEMEALIYQLKQYKRDNQRKEAERLAQKSNPQHNHHAAQAANTPFPLMQAAINQTEWADATFVTEAFYPVLAIQAYQQQLQKKPLIEGDFATTEACIFAQFILLDEQPLADFIKTFNWNVTQQAAIKQALTYLKQHHPTTHIQLFLHHLAILSKHPRKKELLKQVTKIIKMDKMLTLCEVCYMVCLKFVTYNSLSEDKRLADFKKHETDIMLLLQIAASISNHHQTRQKNNFDLMMSEILPHVNTDYQQIKSDNQTMLAFYSCLNRLSLLKSVFRLNLLAAIEKNILLDRKISTEQNHLLFTLRFILGSK